MSIFKGKLPKIARSMVSESRVIGTFYVENPLLIRTFDADLRAEKVVQNNA